MTSEVISAVLLLEDGTVFRGKAIGKIGSAIGELSLNTGMAGYQEAYTDPAAYGKIFVHTASHIGNYGVKSGEDDESDKVHVRGVVCNTFETDHYSGTRADGSLQDYLADHGVVGISDVDTREITRALREKGSMLALISSESEDLEILQGVLKEQLETDHDDPVLEVSTPEAYELGEENTVYKVAVLDFGVKKSLLTALTRRDCRVKIFNAQTSADEILKWKPDGILLSNGQGIPEDMDYAIKTTKTLIDSGLPVFGVGLGHLILGLSVGLEIEKMHQAHSGGNYPVKNLITGLSEITSQGHSRVLKKDTAENHDEAEVTHINLNDGSVEGIRLKNKPVFSVQYNPEASPGPHDSAYLFDDFVAILGV